MTAKRIQNTHKKPNNCGELKKSKLFQAFHKQYTAYEFNKIIKKVTKTKTK